ncbi:MAG: hypothetical protein ETSY1_09235 [Candidatus Entotheonella factor]|uniref:Uncharacterized protein n=1 Tax=Entotheonella factor TaxID=1429438 RepID=W4LTD0_ENTF1|nr:MAG: hypothetical protein ETSY1_09235 [Candidatus Entotheonella factor]
MTDNEPKQLSLIDRRLVKSSAVISHSKAEEITYQHTVFCQTSLPYQNPGADIRAWEREQGRISLKVQTCS